MFLFTFSGIGWYNLKYSFVLSLLPIAFVLDQIGYSIVLPAAACDLNMSDKARGIVASMPYVGMYFFIYAGNACRTLLCVG